MTYRVSYVYGPPPIDLLTCVRKCFILVICSAVKSARLIFSTTTFFLIHIIAYGCFPEVAINAHYDDAHPSNEIGQLCPVFWALSTPVDSHVQYL